MALTIGQEDISERSSNGQVGSNFQQCLVYTYGVSNCSSCCVHAKNICFYEILTSSFEIIVIIQIWSLIIMEEVINCRMAIIDYKKSINRINVQICIISSFNNINIPTVTTKH